MKTLNTRWRTVSAGLARYRVRLGRQRVESVSWDYYARGVGWTSREVAESSWTAAERDAVDAAVDRVEAREYGVEETR